MAESKTRVQLSLGSNAGDRGAMLRAALADLARLPDVELLKVSHCYETEPLGRTDQPAFYNLAAEIGTALGPLELLNAVKAIERGLGRRSSSRWGPREIDIDLILWGAQVMDTPSLTLPHKEFRDRAFVLEPMAEIAPEAVDPITGLTVAELAKRPEAKGSVKRLDSLDTV